MSDSRGAAMAAALAGGCRVPALHPSECPCKEAADLFAGLGAVPESDPLLEAGLAALLDSDEALRRYAFNLGARIGREAVARKARACPICDAAIGEWCKIDGKNGIHKERK